MSQQVTFGQFAFDRAKRTLWSNSALVPLGSHGAALLEALLDAEDGVVTKTELIDRAWPGRIVEDGNLAVQISGLRKTLGLHPSGQEWIITVPRVGYRFLQEGDVGAMPLVRPSIAVLPFANLGGNPADDYFADGLVEDLIIALSRFRTFAVVTRHASFVYKNRRVDTRKAAAELGVRYALEGSVRRSDRRVRVTAQLIEASSGASLWAERLEGKVEDIFDFQDQITERVIGFVEPQIRKAEIVRSRRKRAENLDAYDLYLQALPLIQSANIAGYSVAIELLNRAIELDPAFAPVLALACWAHGKRHARGGIAPSGVDDLRSCRDFAERALAADSDDAVVLAIAGSELRCFDSESERGCALVERAFELNPNSNLVSNLAGFARASRGDWEAAIQCHQRALLLCPGAPERFWSLTGIAQACLSARRPDEALEWARKSLDAYDGLDWTYSVAAAAYGMTGDWENARLALKAALALHPTWTPGDVAGHAPMEARALLIEGFGDLQRERSTLRLA